MHLEDPDILKYVGREHTVVTMNHKYDIDWLMAWILAERRSMLGVCLSLVLSIFVIIIIIIIQQFDDVNAL